jgi:transposase-like protein
MLRKKRLSNAVCPNCNTRKQQLRNGKNQSGSLRVRCKPCGRYYTFRATPYKYTDQKKANTLWTVKYGEFTSLRAVARRANINHQTLRNWIIKDLGQGLGYSYQSYLRQLGSKSKLLNTITSERKNVKIILPS